MTRSEFLRRAMSVRDNYLITNYTSRMLFEELRREGFRLLLRAGYG